jgi:hypothetical protein
MQRETGGRSLYQFIFAGLGFELRVYTLRHSTSLFFFFFYEGGFFFEIGSHELFAPAGFEQRSS